MLFPTQRGAAEAREYRRQKRRLTVRVACAWGCAAAAFVGVAFLRAEEPLPASRPTSRHLLQTVSPTGQPSAAPSASPSSAPSAAPSISPTAGDDSVSTSWNPLKTDTEDKGPLGTAGVAIWFVLLLWLFAGVAVVTDSYFTPALEAISTALGLSEDVAGATFLAAASSAPEFFTSLADTFASDGGGLGIGTIVGSAVFNILVIVALSCIPCDRLNLDWYPLARDSFFYIISIILLLATVLSGSAKNSDGDDVGLVEWYESMIYILGYVAYICYMKYSGSMRPRVVRWKDSLMKTNESGDFPEHDTQADFSCQVVQMATDGGEVELVSNRAGDEPLAARGHPYGGEVQCTVTPHSRRILHTPRPVHDGPHASIPTPRVRKQWQREKERWEKKQGEQSDGTFRPAESAFTRWVIEQRRMREDPEAAETATPRWSRASPRVQSRAPSPQELERVPTQPADAVDAEGDASPPPPANSPSSEPCPRSVDPQTSELTMQISELEKQKEDAKSRDDLAAAVRLKRKIEQLKAGDTSTSSGSEDDDVEINTLTLAKVDFIAARSVRDLELEEDEGEGATGEGDGQHSVKVTKSKRVAKKNGFVVDMEIAKINGEPVATLDDIDDILACVGAADIIIVTTKLEKEDDFWDLDWPEDSQVMRFLWIFVVPLLVLFKLTIPRADRRSTRGYYWVAFGMSIFWIGLLSMYMLKFATWIGAIAQIHPTVMGIVVLAAGTSVPDAIASYCAAKMGMADMAVSNALGSNVFNIFAGLGVPWFLSSVIKSEPIEVPKDGVVIPTIILFVVLFFFLYTLRSYDFTLQPRVGKIFMFVMCLYWTWTLLNEFVLGVKL